MRKITRRGFVKAAAAIGATAAIGRSTISRYVVGGSKSHGITP
jgi:hypothetical protein|uniref:Twin-arginine translocation signal domain-containing protein n=1 Tax=Candidatus Methanophaga sp. ANME-1 ERB7 TaxID=2759913 RepID=A0A7G9ZCL1_9EURY|nr:hypothetical protein NNIPPFBB_00040 [Methanosarcinales archaeon ANME-1 ERB7]